MKEKVKRPASQYYWAEFMSDAALRTCPLVARGLWHEMNCIMHQCEPYGHLYLNGKPMTATQIANLVGLSERECKKLLSQLEDAGVYSTDANGAIYSRRMVRDEAVRNARAEGGVGGKEFGAMGAEHGKKGGRPKGKITPLKTPLGVEENPPPSSSSSSSETTSVAKATGAEAPRDGLSAHESIFQIAVPWLVANGCKETGIRSLLGGAEKHLGPEGAWELVSQCMREKPLEPTAWIAAAVNARIKVGKASRHNGFDKTDYSEGVTADGRIA